MKLVLLDDLQLPLHLPELFPAVLFLAEEAEPLGLFLVLVPVELLALPLLLCTDELVLKLLPLGPELYNQCLQVGQVLVDHLDLVAARLDHELQQVVDSGELRLHVLEVDVEPVLLRQDLVAPADGIYKVPDIVVEGQYLQRPLGDLGQVHEVLDELLLPDGQPLAAWHQLLKPLEYGRLLRPELGVSLADVADHPLKAVHGRCVLPVQYEVGDAVLDGELERNQLYRVDELDYLVDPLVDLVLDAPDVQVLVLVVPGAAVDQLFRLFLKVLGVICIGLDEVVLVDLAYLVLLQDQDVLELVQHVKLLLPDLCQLLHLLQVALESLDVGVNGVVDLDHAQCVDSIIGETDLGPDAAHEVRHIEIHEDVDHLHDHLVDLVPGGHYVARLAVCGHQRQEHHCVEGVPVDLSQALGQ